MRGILGMRAAKSSSRESGTNEGSILRKMHAAITPQSWPLRTRLSNGAPVAGYNWLGYGARYFVIQVEVALGRSRLPEEYLGYAATPDPNKQVFIPCEKEASVRTDSGLGGTVVAGLEWSVNYYLHERRLGSPSTRDSASARQYIRTEAR